MFSIKIVFTELSSAREEAVRSSDVLAPTVPTVRQETETRPPVSAWGRLGTARSDILNLSSQQGDRQTPDSQAGDGQTRCNGKLQRTKRIEPEPEPEPSDDKDSIASVTIISVPSGIVTPVTTSEPREPTLIKQSSLPPPSSHLRNKHLGKRSPSPNSGWL